MNRMKKQIIDFKILPKYYHDEFMGRKAYSVREGTNEEKFKLLEKFEYAQDHKMTKPNLWYRGKNTQTGEMFIRKIMYVRYVEEMNIWCISWVDLRVIQEVVLNYLGKDRAKQVANKYEEALTRND